MANLPALLLAILGGFVRVMTAKKIDYSMLKFVSGCLMSSLFAGLLALLILRDVTFMRDGMKLALVGIAGGMGEKAVDLFSKHLGPMLIKRSGK